MASSRDDQRRRLLIDMSHTAGSQLNSGIQRVVRNLVRYLPEECRRDGFACSAVVWRDGHFYELDAWERGGLRKTYPELVQSLSTSLPAWYRQPVERLCASPARQKLRKLFIPKAGHAGVFSIPLKLRSQWNRCLNEVLPPAGRVRFRADDILFLPDGYWVMNKIWRAVEKVRQGGTQIHTLVYDIIALTHPECFVDGAHERFDAYIANLARHSHHIFTISRTVAKQLTENLRGRGVDEDRLPAISPFLLGCDFHQQAGHVRPEIRAAFAGQAGRSYLSVSTIEPRKNYMFALDAFEHLWKSGSDVRWFIAGRPGWKCEAQLERLANHPQRGTRLHVFHDLSDGELDFAYQSVDGVVCPSIAEGFGLPIVEGLHHDRFVMASDIEIHREVGGDACVYFSLESPQSLAKCIQQHAETATSGHRSGAAKPLPTWEQSAASLWQQMRRP